MPEALVDTDVAGQLDFLFDGPLLHDPISQVPAVRRISYRVVELLALSGAELIECIRQVATTMPDDIDYDDVLTALGVPVLSITAWHGSRAIEALIPPHGEYQAYQPAEGRVRFRRLYPCRGFEGYGCRALTGGNQLCARCQKLEEEDLYNQE